MANYTVTFDKNPRTAVQIETPQGAEPLDYIAWEIARELELLRYEVEIGDHGGHIRRIGDDGPGIAFQLALTEDDDPSPCCPDPQCTSNPCTFPGYVPNN